MANEAVQIKILAEIEYKVIGNAFGALIATGGLLAGSMVSQGSFEYWQEDFLLIGLLAIMSFRLVRSFVAAMTAYQVVPASPQTARHRENVQPDQAVVAQIPAQTNLTPEQLMEEVAKRIETQKAEALKHNKMVN
ncbi:MAG: hypothetical protein WC156_11025 [Pedobacter sp.]